MQIYCKSFKKHKRSTFPKTLFPISKNIVKEKSKCAICLTGRTFIHEIEDKHDLESKVKVYPMFLTDQCYKTKWRIIV